MEHCGFFDARLEGGEYDRVYTAEQHAQYFASFIGNGVFKYNPVLGVVASETAGLSVTLTQGQAWINGYWYKNDEDLELPIALPDESQPRIDAVAIRWNSITRDIKAVVIQGEPNSNPIAPTPVRDMVNYDLILAHIRVNASALRIEDANITDTRLDFDICGFVYTLIDRGEEASLERQVELLRQKVEEFDNEIYFDNDIKNFISPKISIRDYGGFFSLTRYQDLLFISAKAYNENSSIVYEIKIDLSSVIGNFNDFTLLSWLGVSNPGDNDYIFGCSSKDFDTSTKIITFRLGGGNSGVLQRSNFNWMCILGLKKV